MSVSIPQDLLGTNRTPTDEERTELQHLINDGDAKVSTIAFKIASLKMQIMKLEEEKAIIEDAILPLRRAACPFRRLPQDVIREIFIACLSDLRNPTMSNKEAPVLLTQITGSLRRIALTTPALWASIHIPVVTVAKTTLIDSAEYIMALRAEAVREWLLRRSGNMPLRISLYVSPDPSMKNPSLARLIHGIEEVLLACASRWQSAAFACLITSIPRIAALRPSDVPLLGSLTIYHYKTTFPGDEDVPLWDTRELLGSPTLTRLQVQGNARISACSHIKWENITHLHCPARMDGFPETAYSIAQVLRQTTRLISLDLTLRGCAGYGPNKIVDQISLPLLRTFIYTEGPETKSGFLDHLCVPSLLAFSFNNKSRVSFGLVPSVKSFLVRSATIEDLALGSLTSFDVLLEYLTHCPSLIKLHVHSIDRQHYQLLSEEAHDAFLNAFVTPNNDSSYLCPKLETFHCGSVINTANLNCVRNFIKQKQRHGEHLSKWKEVRLAVKYEDDDQANGSCLEEVKLEDADLKLDLSYTSHPLLCRSLNSGIHSTGDNIVWQLKVGVDQPMLSLHST